MRFPGKREYTIFLSLLVWIGNIILAGATIDVILAYDDRHRDYLGHEGFLAEAEANLKFTEAIFRNGGLEVEFNIVHVFHTSKPFERGFAFDCFRYIRSKYTSAFGADLFIFVANNGGLSAKGQAILCGNYCFVNMWYYQAGNSGWTMAHEIGHTLGGGHERPYNAGQFPWSRAVVRDDGGNQWCTVIASGHNGIRNRIPYFSNPKQEYYGISLGSPAYDSQGAVNESGADNLETMRMLLPYAANRESQADFLWSGSMTLPNGYHHVSWFGYINLDQWQESTGPYVGGGRYMYHEHFGWCWIPSGVTLEHLWFWSDIFESWVYTNQNLQKTAWVANHGSLWVTW